MCKWPSSYSGHLLPGYRLKVKHHFIRSVVFLRVCAQVLFCPCGRIGPDRQSKKHIYIVKEETSLKGLNQFQEFNWQKFLEEKRLAFLKSVSWKDGDTEVGSKVIAQIIEDRTQYSKPGIDNFGEQLTVKVRGVAPSAFAQLRPLSTEIVIKDVERVTVYGEYRNQLSIIAKVAVKDAPAKQ